MAETRGFVALLLVASSATARQPDATTSNHTVSCAGRVDLQGLVPSVECSALGRGNCEQHHDGLNPCVWMPYGACRLSASMICAGMSLEPEQVQLRRQEPPPATRTPMPGLPTCHTISGKAPQFQRNVFLRSAAPADGGCEAFGSCAARCMRHSSADGAACVVQPDGQCAARPPCGSEVASCRGYGSVIESASGMGYASLGKGVVDLYQDDTAARAFRVQAFQCPMLCPANTTSGCRASASVGLAVALEGHVVQLIGRQAIVDGRPHGTDTELVGGVQIKLSSATRRVGRSNVNVSGVVLTHPRGFALLAHEVSHGGMPTGYVNDFELHVPGPAPSRDRGVCMFGPSNSTAVHVPPSQSLFDGGTLASLEALCSSASGPQSALFEPVSSSIVKRCGDTAVRLEHATAACGRLLPQDDLAFGACVTEYCATADGAALAHAETALMNTLSAQGVEEPHRTFATECMQASSPDPASPLLSPPEVPTVPTAAAAAAVARVVTPFCPAPSPCTSEADCEEERCANLYRDVRDVCGAAGMCATCNEAIVGLMAHTDCFNASTFGSLMGDATRKLTSRVGAACHASQSRVVGNQNAPGAIMLAADVASERVHPPTAEYQVVKDTQCGFKTALKFKGRRSMLAAAPTECKAACTKQGSTCRGFIWTPNKGDAGHEAENGTVQRTASNGGSCFFRSSVEKRTPFTGRDCYVRSTGGSRAAALTSSFLQLSSSGDAVEDVVQPPVPMSSQHPHLEAVRIAVFNETGTNLAVTEFDDIEVEARRSYSLIVALSEPQPHPTHVQLQLTPAGDSSEEMGGCQLSAVNHGKERGDRQSNGGALLELALHRFEAQRVFHLTCHTSVRKGVWINAQLGCEPASWRSAKPVTVVQQGRIALTVSAESTPEETDFVSRTRHISQLGQQQQ